MPLLQVFFPPMTMFPVAPLRLSLLAVHSTARGSFVSCIQRLGRIAQRHLLPRSLHAASTELLIRRPRACHGRCHRACRSQALALFYQFHVQTRHTKAQTSTVLTKQCTLRAATASRIRTHQIHTREGGNRPAAMPPATGARISTRTTRAVLAAPLHAHQRDHPGGPTAARRTGCRRPGAARATRPRTASAAARRRPRRAAGAASTCRGSVLRAWAPTAARTSSTGARSAAVTRWRRAGDLDRARKRRGAQAAVGRCAHLSAVVRPQNQADARPRPGGSSL